MATKLKLFDLKLDRVRKVRMDLGALEDAEDVSGHPFLVKGMNDLSSKALSALVWASCKHEDPDLTREQVRGMIHAGNLNDTIEVLAHALMQAIPEQEEPADGAEGNGDAAAKPNGKKS
jgi:hypothetical protein